MADVSETLARLERAGAAIEAGVGAPGQQRAASLAQALLLLWPGAARVECQLSGVEGDSHAAFGEPTGHELRVAITADGDRGSLAVSPPQPSSEDGALLRLCARRAGLLLARDRLLAGRRRAQDLIEMGELAGPVMHEFNDLLNSLSLRLAVLEHDTPGLSPAAFDRVRTRSAQSATLVAHYQAHRRSRSADRTQLDLRRLLEQAATTGSGLALDPQGPSPLVLADETDLRNLLTFVTRYSSSYSPAAPDRIRASLSVADGWAALRLDSAGPPPRPGADYFAPRTDAAAPACGLELAACRSLVQRSGGRIRASAGGDVSHVLILVELPLVQRSA